MPDTLRLNEIQFRETLENVRLIVAQINLDGVVTFANSYCLDVLGYGSEDVIGKNWFDCFVPPEIDLKSVFLSGKGSRNGSPSIPPHYENDIITRTGERRTIFWNNTYLYDSDGTIMGITGIGEDVTDRRLMEKKLTESESRLREAQRFARLGSFEVTIDTGALWWSDETYSIFGVEPATFQPSMEKYPDFVHPLDRERVLGTLDHAGKTGLPYKMDYRIIRPDDQTVWLHSEAVVVKDETGRPQMIRGTTQDVTEQKIIEESLRHRESRLAAAQRIAKVGSWDIPFPSGPLWWSDEMYRLTGVDRETFVPTRDSCRPLVFHEDIERASQQVTHCIRTGESFEQDWRVARPDGKIIWVRVVAHLRRDASGEPEMIVGTAQDITERKEEEAERRRLEEQMQKVQELDSLGVLAGGVAHDFNNLLTPILGYARLAASSVPENSKTRKYLDEVEHAALRAAELCRQILAYAGRGRFIIGPVNLTLLVREMSQLLQATLSPKAKVELDLQEDLPLVNADATQIRQVVMNLLTNASDALVDGPGTISISTGMIDASTSYLAEGYPQSSLPAGPYVFVEVRDTGVGMDAETIRRIFDPFFTTKFTGRGLGLAAALGIIRSHRGVIRVGSEPNKGSVFRILLPPSSARTMSELPGTQNEIVKGKGIVLIVDDHEAVRNVARAGLEMAGYEVLLASDGVEAVSVFNDAPKIDAVVLDLTMPRRGGLETLAEIRKISSDVPVILMSGYGEKDLQSRFAGLGFSAFLPKPFVPTDLIQSLKQVIKE